MEGKEQRRQTLNKPTRVTMLIRGVSSKGYIKDEREGVAEKSPEDGKGVKKSRRVSDSRPSPTSACLPRGVSGGNHLGRKEKESERFKRGKERNLFEAFGYYRPGPRWDDLGVQERHGENRAKKS